jgi:hypothetical protein
MKIADVVKEDITRRGVAEDSSGLEKLHNTLWTAISEQTIDEETINEIDPGMMANLYSVFPTVAKIIVSNALSKARKEAKETSLMIDVMKKHANSQPVTPQENEAMLTQFKDIVSYGLSAVAGVLTATVAGPAAGAGVALAGVYKKELLTLLQTKGPEVLIGLLKSKGKLDVVDILSANFLGKHAAPFYTAPAKPPNSGIDQQGNKIKEQGMEEGEGNFVGDFPQPNIGGATVKPMQVGDTVSYFGQTAKIQAQSPDRKHSRIEITKGTGGVVQTVLTSDLKRVRRGMTEGMAQDEAEEYSGWRAEFVNQINYNTFEVKMTNTRSRESANFVVRPVDMISHGPTLAIETMDVHDLQTGQTASWTSDDPQPDGGIVYAISGMFYDNKELQRKLWTIVDTHNTKGQDKMPGLDQRRSIGQEVDADAYIDSQEKTQDVMNKMKKGMSEEFRPTTGQAMGIRSQIAQKMNPDNNKFIWKRPNQIMGSHTENELRALKFRYSAKHNAWGGTKDMWGRLEGTLKEFSPIKPPTAGAFGGNKDYGQPTSSRYLGNNKFVLGTTNNYVLTATVDKWGLEWDEDDEIWFLDSPGAVYIADATEGEIELPAPQEQRNQIHDLVSDYLNARNSAELQRVAAYYGHSADGEMATSEGVRVSGQQILGTKNRAKSAYYPTNVKPKVPKLDKPLTDQELARLAQLAGIKSK